jgi:hypothetical protein
METSVLNFLCMKNLKTFDRMLSMFDKKGDSFDGRNFCQWLTIAKRTKMKENLTKDDAELLSLFFQEVEAHAGMMKATRWVSDVAAF